MDRLKLFCLFCFFSLALWLTYTLGGFIFIGDLIFLGKKYKTERTIDRIRQTVDYTQFVNEYSESYLGEKKTLRVGIDTFDLIPVYWNTEIMGWNPDPKTLQNKLTFWFFPSLSKRINGYNMMMFFDASRFDYAVTQRLSAVGNEIELIDNDTIDRVQITNVSHDVSYYQTLDYMNRLTGDELLLVGISDQAGNTSGSYRVTHLKIK